MATTSSAGNITDKYQVLELLDTGDDSAVYRAVRKEDNTFVVIKEFRIDNVEEQGVILKELQQVAQVLLEKGPEYPTLVRILDHLTDPTGDTLWIISEFAEGLSVLDAAIIAGPLTEIQIRAVMYCALSSAVDLHSRGLIHGNIKASNLLLTGGPYGVYFADAVDLGKFKGTIYQASPDHFTDSFENPDLRDSWSLAIAAIELAHRISPFRLLDDEAARESILRGPQPTVSPDCFSQNALLTPSTPLANFQGYLSAALAVDPGARLAVQDCLTLPWFEGLTLADALPILRDLIAAVNAKLDLRGSTPVEETHPPSVLRIRREFLTAIMSNPPSYVAPYFHASAVNSALVPSPLAEKPPSGRPLGTPVTYAARPPNLQGKKLLEILKIDGFTDEVIVRAPGDVKSQAMLINNCKRCTILILDGAAAITIDDCEECTFVFLAVSGSVFFRKCWDCPRVYLCAGQLRLRDCHNMEFRMWCNGPVIEASYDIRSAPWNLSVPMDAHMAALSAVKMTDKLHRANLWWRIFDFHKEDRTTWPLPHWKKVDVTSPEYVNSSETLAFVGEDGTVLEAVNGTSVGPIGILEFLQDHEERVPEEEKGDIKEFQITTSAVEAEKSLVSSAPAPAAVEAAVEDVPSPETIASPISALVADLLDSPEATGARVVGTPDEIRAAMKKKLTSPRNHFVSCSGKGDLFLKHSAHSVVLLECNADSSEELHIAVSPCQGRVVVKDCALKGTGTVHLYVAGTDVVVLGRPGMRGKLVLHAFAQNSMLVDFGPVHAGATSNQTFVYIEPFNAWWNSVHDDFLMAAFAADMASDLLSVTNKSCKIFGSWKTSAIVDTSSVNALMQSLPDGILSLSADSIDSHPPSEVVDRLPALKLFEQPKGGEPFLPLTVFISAGHLQPKHFAAYLGVPISASSETEKPKPKKKKKIVIVKKKKASTTASPVLPTAPNPLPVPSQADHSRAPELAPSSPTPVRALGEIHYSEPPKESLPVPPSVHSDESDEVISGDDIPVLPDDGRSANLPLQISSGAVTKDSSPTLLSRSGDSSLSHRSSSPKVKPSPNEEVDITTSPRYRASKDSSSSTTISSSINLPSADDWRALLGSASTSELLEYRLKLQGKVLRKEAQLALHVRVFLPTCTFKC